MEPAQKAKIMTLTNPFVEIGIERGIERGIEKGCLQGESRLVLRQLRRRFGALDAVQEAMVRSLSVEQLEDLGDALLSFQSVQDLNDWLARSH